MSFKVESLENAQVVRVTESVFFDTVQDFDSSIQQAEDTDCKSVIVDLTDIEMICSSAITILVKHHMSLQKKSGRLIVSGCNISMMRIMQLLGLNKLMLFADDLQAALKL
ncbi:MAG: STAS domain-containing protein [Candidatus Riflebacteria bacterium]|nr:STAS domain-containing protein [Candidatus Riflebacteria bacterium]